MDFKQVTVIGANCITVSIALGLKKLKGAPEIVGYDSEALAADLSRSMGAFDRVERKIERACQGADLVIVGAPFSDLYKTLSAIAPHLEPGCVVTDIAPLKAPVMRWAEELLPASVSFVGSHPIPNPAIVGFDPLQGLDEADEDLLVEALYLLTTSPKFPNADPIADLAVALEAHPYFMDAVEHDGMHAGVEGLPDLLAAALLRATVDTAGWEEMRKFAGRSFAAATVCAEGTDDHMAVFLNRENVLLRLNVLLNELIRLRDLISQDDAELVEEVFAAAAEGRGNWILERERGMWTKERVFSKEEMPSLGQQFSQMLFGGTLARRLKEGPGRPRKDE
jgi:prephenate dehydrogenase